jgi:protein-tyrosine phosphatase
MKILMICLGNICRSPLAHGIMQKMVESKGLDWSVDSCGTSGFHDGELPDSRSIEVARKHDLDITYQRSRRLTVEDTREYDLLIAMDQSNYNNIKALAAEEHHHKIKLLLNYSHPGENRRVPDPYYEGGFDLVYDMIYDACEQIIQKQ